MLNPIKEKNNNKNSLGQEPCFLFRKPAFLMGWQALGFGGVGEPGQAWL